MKRYCDYDAIVHYQPGEFASKFADNLNEKLKPANLDALEDEQANTFKDGQYGTFLTRLPLTVYRLYGKYQSNNDMGGIKSNRCSIGGQYVSTEFAESCIDAKIRLALDPCWHNTKMHEAKLIIPAGIKLYVGKVAPVKLCTGTILPGAPHKFYYLKLARGMDSRLPPRIRATTSDCSDILANQARRASTGKRRTLSRCLPTLLLFTRQESETRRGGCSNRLKRAKLYTEKLLPESGLRLLLVKSEK